VMTVLVLLLLFAAVAVVVWLFPRTSGGPTAGQRALPNPQEVPADRLARGEIDIETYRAVLAELRARGPDRHPE
jgi:uncharacterized membrane protein